MATGRVRWRNFRKSNSENKRDSERIMKNRAVSADEIFFRFTISYFPRNANNLCQFPPFRLDFRGKFCFIFHLLSDSMPPTSHASLNPASVRFHFLTSFRAFFPRQSSYPFFGFNGRDFYFRLLSSLYTLLLFFLSNEHRERDAFVRASALRFCKIVSRLLCYLASYNCVINPSRVPNFYLISI